MAMPPAQSRATDSISFFDLSPELRNEIYGYATVVDKTVAVRTVPSNSHCYEFIVCPDGDQAHFVSLFVTLKTLPRGCKLLDGALMLTCKEIRNEALAVLLSRNHIVLTASSYFGLRRYPDDFSNFYCRLRTVTLVAGIGLHDLHSSVLDGLRCFSSHATMLTELSMCVGWFTESHHDQEEQTLNFFRPLSKLPLRKATVQAFSELTIYEERCQKAEAILLRDCNQDEEAQVKEVETTKLQSLKGAFNMAT